MENNRECHHCRLAHPELCTSFPQGTMHSGGGSADELRRMDEIVAEAEAAGLPSRLAADARLQYRVMRMPLEAGTRSMTLDGAPAVDRRFGALPDLDLGDLLLYHYPSSWNHFMADHAVTFRMLPLGPTTTELRTTWLVPPGGDADDLARLTAVWTATNRQDTTLVERAQRGVALAGISARAVRAHRGGGCDPVRRLVRRHVARQGRQIGAMSDPDVDAVVGQPFPHVFRPLTLRHLTLRNRIVFGAHTTNMAEQGLPGRQHLAYYRERALGGAAMIVVEPVPVHPTAVLTRGNFLVGDDAVMPGFRAITDACHAEGAAMIQQLYHVGQHGDFDNSFRPSWSPSGLPSFHDAEGSHAASDGEIEEVIDGFVDAAVRARRCGFDGVEIFAAYHAFVDQFWSPWSNRRTDRWGGVVRGPDALLGDDPRTHPRRRRRRLRDRAGRQRRSDGGCPAEPGRAVRDRRLARRARADGLRHLRHGQLRRLLRHHPDPPVGRQSGRGDGRRAVQGGAPRQGPGREPRPHGGQRRSRVGVGRRRPRVDRARSDRRPPPRGQGPGRPATGRAHVHLLQPDVLGTAVSRLLDLVPRQPVGRSGGRVGWRPVHRGRRTGAGAGRRRRSRRARGGPRRRRARPRRHARRGDRPARRRVPARRPAAAAGPDPRPAGLVRTPARAARRRRAAGHSSRR